MIDSAKLSFESASSGNVMLEIGTDKVRNLTIQNGGNLEAKFIQIGDKTNFTTGEHEKGALTNVVVKGNGSKISSVENLSVDNGSFKILDKAEVSVDGLDIADGNYVPYIAVVEVDDATLNAGEIWFERPRAELNVKNGANLHVAEELGTKGVINVENSNLNGSSIRITDGGVSITDGSKAKFTNSVKTEGGTLTIADDGTALDIDGFLRAGQSKYTDELGVIHKAVGGNINIKDGFITTANLEISDTSSANIGGKIVTENTKFDGETTLNNGANISAVNLQSSKNLTTDNVNLKVTENVTLDGKTEIKNSTIEAKNLNASGEAIYDNANLNAEDFCI
ncbi:MAG: hypothetical protein MR902_03945 [Campylobacter sp.]|nr:hypothetical protein [Campylobacter sp.]